MAWARFGAFALLVLLLYLVPVVPLLLLSIGRASVGEVLVPWRTYAGYVTHRSAGVPPGAGDIRLALVVTEMAFAPMVHFLLSLHRTMVGVQSMAGEGGQAGALNPPSPS